MGRGGGDVFQMGASFLDGGCTPWGGTSDVMGGFRKKKEKRNLEHLRLNKYKMKVTFMSTSDTPSGVQLVGR